MELQDTYIKQLEGGMCKALTNLEKFLATPTVLPDILRESADSLHEKSCVDTIELDDTDLQTIALE